MGKKTPLSNFKSYEEKVSYYLSQMLNKTVKFTKTDSAAVIEIPDQGKYGFKQHISLSMYWEFAKHQTPGYVAQTIVENHLPTAFTDYYTSEYMLEWPQKHKYKSIEDKVNLTPNPMYAKNEPFTYYLDGKPYPVTSTVSSSYKIAPGKGFMVASNTAGFYSPDPISAAQVVSIKITPDLTQFNKGFQELGKAMKQASEQMAKAYAPVFEHMQKALAEANKQANALAAKGMPARSVLSHPGLAKIVKCPQCRRASDMQHIIIHLNDQHRWKREAIADWLDTLDEQPVFYPDIKFEAEGA